MKKVNILFCGLIRAHDLFKKSISDMTQLRDNGLIENIYLSTWIGEIDKAPEIKELLKKSKVKIIESEEPEVGGEGNIWKQMKALDEGLKKIDKNSFILKTRSDVYINPDFLRKIFSQQGLFKITKNLPNGNVFKAKIWVPWYEITRPFYMADECFFGLKEDIRLLVNYENKYFSDYVLGPGGPHIMRFIHPFLEKYPVLYDSLTKYSDESELKRVIRKFSRKVFSLDKFKFLKRLNEKNRFNLLSKRLSDESYIKYLAASYTILNSHFYISSGSFPEQVIFREHSKPKVKLNSLNWESNFSHEMARFEYGGQIYDYNEDLLNNLCDKKIEATEVSKKLLEAIDSFNQNS